MAGVPRAIRCDNGPELIAQPQVDWCRAHAVELRHIRSCESSCDSCRRPAMREDGVASSGYMGRERHWKAKPRGWSIVEDVICWTMEIRLSSGAGATLRR